MFFYTFNNFYLVYPDFLLFFFIIFLFIIYVFFFIFGESKFINTVKILRSSKAINHLDLFYKIIIIFLIFLFFNILFVFFNYESPLFLIFNQLYIDYKILYYKMVIIFLSIFFFFVSWLSRKSNIFLTIDHLFLFLLAILGSFFLVSANDFLIFYLALELVSIPLYILAASNIKSITSVEAGLKYFIIGACSSGFILLGLSFFYGFFGITNFTDFNLLYSFALLQPTFFDPTSLDFLLDQNSIIPFEDFNIISLAFLSKLTLLQPSSTFFFNYSFILYILMYNHIVIGFFISFLFFFLGFILKLGLAPFHFWLPDVYLGAPTIVTLFFMTVQKFILWSTFFELFFSSVKFGFFFDVLKQSSPFFYLGLHFGVGSKEILYFILLFLIICNLIWGVFPTIYQTNLKSLLVYSSIGTNGLLLFCLILKDWSIFSLFLFIYILSTFALFIAIFLLTDSVNLKSIINFSSLINSFRKNPFFCILLSINIISFSGLPPAFGFFTKLFIYYSAVLQEHFILIFISIFFSLFMSFYYFRVLRYLFIVDNLQSKFLHLELNDNLLLYDRIIIYKSITFKESQFLYFLLSFLSWSLFVSFFFFNRFIYVLKVVEYT